MVDCRSIENDFNALCTSPTGKLQLTITQSNLSKFREKDIAIKLEDQFARLREIFDKCDLFIIHNIKKFSGTPAGTPLYTDARWTAAARSASRRYASCSRIRATPTTLSKCEPDCELSTVFGIQLCLGSQMVVRVYTCVERERESNF